MKKKFKILLYAGVFIASLAMLSCAKEGNLTGDPTDGITLTFRTSLDAGVQVKSTPTEGEDAFNENLLNSVYYFLYPKDVTNAAASVSGFKTGLSETEEYEVKVPVSTNTVINDLFASDHQCQLFAVANPPASLVSALEGAPTLAQLRSMIVLSSLTEVPQDNFTMVYDGLVDEILLSGKLAVDADVPLKHLAVKFTIGALVAPSIEYTRNGVLYTYRPKAVSASLCNCINRTTLSGWNKDVIQDGDYFNTEYAAFSSLSLTELYFYQEVTDADEIAALPTPIDESLTGVPSAPDSGSPQAIKVAGKYYKLEQEQYQKATGAAPFYSYPMEWEFNSETEPYLMYRVDWNYDGSTDDPLPLYYKLTLGRKSITQNEWYDISAKLTIAGSLYPEEPTEIYYYMDYLVNGWKNALDDNGINTPAEIKDTRYLAVPQTEFVLNNKNEITIPFSSSHECEVVNKSIKTTNYSNGEADTNASPHFTTVNYDLDTPNELTVTHEIYNTLGSGMDCAPIIIEFDLRHKTNTAFIEHIRIEQNPAIVVKAEVNSAGGVNGANNCGNTYVNNVSGISSGWETVLGANTGGPNENNGSIYMVVVTVSQFDQNSQYIIGDPRDPNVNNLDKNSGSDGVQWNTYNPYKGTAKYHGDGLATDGTRTIKYYHPTIDDGTRDNYVSPSFRVNSANCRRNGNDAYEDSKQRCASFQEDGYPAGRWRLPTLAECKLMQTLSTKGMVPKIFIQNGSSKYHYAGGYFTISTGGDGNYREGDFTTTAAARCVYDEWYWSQVDAKLGWNNSTKTFTWGDVPDDFVIPTPTPTP